MKTINFRENPNQNVPDNFTGKVIHTSGNIFYCQNGKRHRIGGPAVEAVNGYKGYYINGKHVTKKEHDLLVLMYKLKRIETL